MKLLKSALSLALSFQIAFATVVLTYGLPAFSVGPAAPKATNEASPLIAAADAIDSADGSSYPARPADAFHLANQTSWIGNKRGSEENKYDLSRPDLSIPSVTVADFEQEVMMTADSDGSLLMTYTKAGKILARHKLGSVKPLAMARDKELMVVLDQSGDLLAIDIGYARLKAFSSPVPVIELTKSGLTPDELKMAKAAFLTRGQNPMLRSTSPTHIFPEVAEGPREVMTAGDLALYTQAADGERTMVGQFSRDVIRTQLYTGEATLSMMSFVLSPPEDAAKIAGTVADLVKSSQTEKESARVTGLTEVERAAISSVSIERLIQRAQTNREKTKRDKFTRQEWQDYASLIRERAHSIKGAKPLDQDLRDAAARGDLGESWQEMSRRAQKASVNEFMDPRPTWYRMMTSKGVRFLAAAASGTALSAGLAAHTAWGIHAMNLAYENYWPAVLKDSVYRVTLLKSSVALLSFVPLAYGLGMIAATKAKFGPIKALATQTIRIYAELSLPFWHRISGLIRQPNLMRALAQGLSPATKVRADSPIGKRLGLVTDARPALLNPLRSKIDRKTNELAGARVLNALAEQKARVQSLSWLIALQTASFEAGIDPATMALLSGPDGEAFQKDQLEQVISTKEFKAHWAQLATELQTEFGRIARNDDLEAISQIDPKELNTYFEFARLRSKEIRSRDKTGRVLARLKNGWLGFAPKLAKGFATFGKAETDFLREVVPNDFVVSQFWKQFTVDYFLSVAQIGLVGPRADMSNPDALAANKDSVLWTVGGHRFEMVDQVRIYVLSVPASFVQTFQDPAQVRADGYDPIETISMEGVSQSQALGEATKMWLKETLDPKQADEYGSRSIRSFVRNVRTSQNSIMWSMFGRIAVAGQAPGAAIASWFLWLFAGRWLGGGLLWDPINFGNQRYEAAIESRKAELIEARGEISQGLRIDDSALLISGYSKLARLTIDADAKSEDAQMFEQLAKSLETVIDEDLNTLRVETAPYVSAMTDLRRALQDGNPRRLTTARSALEAIYAAHGLADSAAARAQLSSINFLEYSLRNPPYATKANGFLTWATTIVGAALTTYVGTMMAVFTFKKDINWPVTLLESATMSAGLYASYYYGTKWIAKKARARADAKAEAEALVKIDTDSLAAQKSQRSSSRQIRSCRALFGAV